MHLIVIMLVLIVLKLGGIKYIYDWSWYAILWPAPLILLDYLIAWTVGVSLTYCGSGILDKVVSRLANGAHLWDYQPGDQSELQPSPDDKPVSGQFIRKNSTIIQITNNRCSDSLWVWLWSEGWRNIAVTEEDIEKYRVPLTSFEILQRGDGRLEWTAVEQQLIRLKKDVSDE